MPNPSRRAGSRTLIYSIDASNLPCCFRPTKDWDSDREWRRNLSAVIEIKVALGSFGNNFNNRAEEALGQRDRFLGGLPRRRLSAVGAAMARISHDAGGSPTSIRPSALRKLRAFSDAPRVPGISYAQRYEIFCERLVRERLYDATCFLMSSQERGLAGEYIEPSIELSFRNFAASLYARAAAFVQLHNE